MEAISQSYYDMLEECVMLSCTLLSYYYCETKQKMLSGFLLADSEFSCRNDKGDTINASYYHLVSPLSSTAVGAELTHNFSTNENSLTFGTQHALDPLTIVKARLNNYGKASALIQHEWRPKSFFTISGEMDSKAIEKGAKVGLALVLRP